VNFIAAVLIIVVVSAVANYAVVARSRFLANLIHIVSALFHLALLVVGLMMSSAAVAEFMSASGPPEFASVDYRLIALPIVAVATIGFLLSFKAVRQLLGRLMPIDPESPVHTIALILFTYVAANAVVTLSQDVPQALLEGGQAADLYLVVLSNLILVLVAFLGVGFLIRRSPLETLARLGIGRISGRMALVASGWIVALVIMQLLFGVVWSLLFPEQSTLVDDANLSLLRDFDTVGEWLGLAASSGIGEEILFRGALQPMLGLPVSAALFALIHVQYGASLVLPFIFMLALVLGFIRQRYNTTTAILVHVGYNFVLGLLSLLATSLT